MENFLKLKWKYCIYLQKNLLTYFYLIILASCHAQNEEDIELDMDIGASKEGSRTG